MAEDPLIIPIFVFGVPGGPQLAESHAVPIAPRADRDRFPVVRDGKGGGAQPQGGKKPPAGELP